MVLLHQLLYVGQHQYLSSGKARQFGDNQAFTGTGGQHDDRRLIRFAEVVKRGIDGFLLVGAEFERQRHGRASDRLEMGKANIVTKTMAVTRARASPPRILYKYTEFMLSCPLINGLTNHHYPGGDGIPWA